jgi:hypothetical protein
MPGCGLRSGWASLPRGSRAEGGQILTISLQQIEGAQQGGQARGPRPDQVEHGETGLVADDGLAVDQARAHRQHRDRR